MLSVTAFITFRAYSLKSYSGKTYTKEIPIILGEWFGNEIGMNERSYQILETRDAILREYRNSKNESLSLAVVFSKDNRKISHPPEVCFSGGGWERLLKDTETIQLNGETLKLNKLILKKNSLYQVALYLYKSGDNLTENYYLQQVNIILNGMLRKNVSSALIRISAFSSVNDLDRATALTKKFAVEAIPVVIEKLP